MPIPALNAFGLLPEGVHDCTLDEIGARFGRFIVSERRVRLFAQLHELIAEEQRAGIASAVIVDGSFVTDKPEPGDVDLVIILSEGYNFSGELPPFKYNALSKAHLHKRYGFDVFVVEADSLQYARWLTLFQQDKLMPSRRKGILRIAL